MRPFLAFALLVGCGSDPAPQSGPDAAVDAPSLDAAPDAPGPVGCTPGRVEACPCGLSSGTQVCRGDGTFDACVCPDAPAPMDATADAASDAPAPMDAGPEAAADAAQDTDPRASEVCRSVNATCDGRRVNVQTGERDGGLTYHCGGCGNTCPAGSGCNACVCERL